MLNPAIRQTFLNPAIGKLLFWIESGNPAIVNLKEIQEVLPDCSERTIRYDLEDLIERNLVERIGAGGPAVSYRIRQIA